jgi:hypothetical protein
MKKWILFAIAVAAFAFSAAAQIGAGQYVVVSGTTSGAYAAITNNTTAYPTNAIVDCTSKKDVCFAFVSALSDAGTTANTVTIYQSVDKQSWQQLTAFTATPAGTTAVTVVTNIAVGAAPYLKVYSIANANANTGYMTNYTIRAYVK